MCSATEVAGDATRDFCTIKVPSYCKQQKKAAVDFIKFYLEQIPDFHSRVFKTMIIILSTSNVTL